jgi:glycosyltransferase involved in cell wall biosynthesis
MIGVDVVIPATDKSLKLARSIQSVLSQTADVNFTIFVVENNSINKQIVPEIIEQFGSDKIVHLYLDKCRNASVARNYGAKIGRGSYVAFLDSDDEWLPMYIETCLAEIGDYEALFSGFNSVDEAAIYSVLGVNNGDLESDLIIARSVDVRSSVLFFTRASFLDVGFDESLDKHQDWGLMLDFSKKYGIKYLKLAMVNIYLDVSGRMSSKLNGVASRYFLENKLSVRAKCSFALSRMTECLYAEDRLNFIEYDKYLNLGSEALSRNRKLLKLAYKISCKSRTAFYFMVLVVVFYRNNFVKNR